jgi:hypothetical protein
MRIAACGPSRNSYPPVLSVYDGTLCRGHLLNRGVTGWEAFDADDRSVGLFKTPHEAANALTPDMRTPS